MRDTEREWERERLLQVTSCSYSTLHPALSASPGLTLLPLTCVYAKHNIAVEELEEALAATAAAAEEVFRSVAKSLLVK